MNIHSSRRLRRLGAILVAGLFAATAFPQGSLTPPPGTPGPTQKTLQQIWDKIDALETQARSLEDQVGTLQTDNAALSVILDAAGISLPWRTLVATNTPWKVDTLSLAISPRGAVAISWGENFTNGFARLESSRWQTKVWPAQEFVDPNWRNFDFTAGALGFTPSGQAVVAGSEVHTGVATNLVLRSVAGVATNTLVFPVHEYAYRPQLAFSGEGHPRVSYHNWDGAVRLVEWTTGGFTNTLVAAGSDPVLAVSHEGQTGIAYRAFDPGTGDPNLRYAFRHEASFTNALVAAFAFRYSLAFDPAGQPVIAYTDWNGFGVDLKLATPPAGGLPGSSGLWNVETIDSDTSGLGGGWTSDVSLVFGPNGRPSIAYSDLALGVRHASKNAGGGWDITQIAPPNSSGSKPFDTVMRFNRSGQPVIAFCDELTNTIRVATRAPFVAP